MAASDLYHEYVGAGSPVLLLHPGFADSRIWDPQWEHYAQRFRAIRCDLRGFGRSSDPRSAAGSRSSSPSRDPIS